MDHTKEPWKADGTIIYADYGIQTHIADLNGFTNTPESNAKRISDCVTACAGMIDPAEEIAWLCNSVDTQEVELSSLRAALAEKTAQVEMLIDALDIFASYECERPVRINNEWPPTGAYHFESCMETNRPHNEWCAVCRAREVLASINRIVGSYTDR